MNRGAGRRIVFRDDCERQLFVDQLAQFEERFGIEVHGFCLMGNHYHAVLRSGAGRLSEAMAWLGSRFTLAVNAERDVDGAIFRGRFHSVHVERDEHLDWLHRYVNSNPTDLGWTRPLADYPWSGLATTLGDRSDQPWLRTDYFRSRFGAGACRLETFVEAARVPGPLWVSGSSGSSIDEVLAAVELASGPGPDVNSVAEQRAAQTIVGLRRGLSDIPPLAALEGDSAKAYVRRAHRAMRTNSALARLVDRVESVLEVGTERRRSCA